jgi:hypothetical protein
MTNCNAPDVAGFPGLNKQIDRTAKDGSIETTIFFFDPGVSGSREEAEKLARCLMESPTHG